MTPTRSRAHIALPTLHASSGRSASLKRTLRYVLAAVAALLIPGGVVLSLRAIVFKHRAGQRTAVSALSSP